MKKLNSLLIKIGILITTSITILIAISIQNNTINTKNISEFYLGNKNTKHTLTFYFSLECEYCRDFFLNIIPYIKKTYLKDNYLKIVFKEIPLNNSDIDFFIFAKSYDTNTYVKIVSDYYRDYFRAPDINLVIKKIAKKINKKISQNQNLLRKKLKLTTMNFLKNTSNSLPYFEIDNQKFDHFISKTDLIKIISGEIIIKKN